MAFFIGQKFIILRTGESLDVEGRMPIILGPGRAFGSGEHETTRDCLEELEKIPLTCESKVLDIGCGSGILAIAAARLGSGHVFAFDTDVNAIATARANITLNRLAGKIEIFRGELAAVKAKNFSVILANLYGDILYGLVKDLSRLMVSEGFLLLSGILYEYAFDIKSRAAENGWVLMRAHYLDDYTTLLFKKRRTDF